MAAETPVTVCRLWPGPQWEASPAPGSVVSLPPAEAEALVARGAAFPIYEQSEDDPGPGARPLAGMVRRLAETDPELAGLLHAQRKHAAARADGRRAYAALHPEYAGPLRCALPAQPPAGSIRPALFSAERYVAEFGAEPASGWYADIRGSDRAALLAFHIRRRTSEALAAIFDRLRGGQLVAHGRPVASPGELVCIGGDVFAAPSAVVATRTGDLSIGGRLAFTDAEVEAPQPKQRSVSRAALDCYAAAFGAEMAALARRFTSAELAATAQMGFGVSAREVAAALKRVTPTSWAGPGRRAVALAPTAVELAVAAHAARRAVEAAGQR